MSQKRGSVKSRSKSRRRAAPSKSTPEGGRRRTRTNRVFSLAIAGVAAVAGGFAGAQPTGTAEVDVAFCALTGFVVTLATSAARRWTWPILAGLAVVIGGTIWATLLAAVALGFAMYSAIFSSRRDRVTGAVIGALSVQALLRGADIGFHGLTIVLGVIVCTIVAISAYRTQGRRSRRRIRQAVYLVSSVAVLGVVALVVSVLSAKTDIDDGVSRSRAGLEAVREGHQAVAKSQWSMAGQSFASAEETLNNPWMKIAYAVPVVSQHARAISSTAHSGAQISSTAADAAGVAPYRSLRSRNGAINVSLIRKMQDPVEDTYTALLDARLSFDALDSDWLLPQLRAPLATFEDELDHALPEAARAHDALAVAPELLGGDGLRRYLVLFGTPSETRGLGGFIGSWAELDVDNGKFTLARHGKIGALNEGSPVDQRTITGQPEYVARYGYLQPTRFLQNISASPDFPTVADVASQLYPQAGGTEIDGTIYVDPYALAAFLELTGPVKAEGIPEPLTADNAAQYLLHDQYLQFPDTDARSDLLSNASEATFNALTRRDLPNIAEIAEVLSPMVHQKRLLFTSEDPRSDRFLADIGLTGAFLNPDGNDFLSLRTSNGSGNKIDYYLRRSVEYQARFDPETGQTESVATITLENTAPSGGEPSYVLGNSDTIAERPGGRPYASNTVVFSLYSPLSPVAMTIDGKPTGVQVEQELGYVVASGSVTIPSGESAVVEIDLEGHLTPGRTYSLHVDPQPLVDADSVTVDVRPLTSSDHLVGPRVGRDGAWTWSGPLPVQRAFQSRFDGA